MLLLPESLKNVAISAEAKRFLQALKNRLPNEYTGVYGVNLTGHPDDEHFILLSSAGLIVMRFLDVAFDVSNTLLLQMFFGNFQNICTVIQNRLSTHSILKDKEQKLVFPVRVLYVFTGTSEFGSLENASNAFFVSRCLRSNSWLSATRKNAEFTFLELLNEPDNQPSVNAKSLTQVQIDTIINRLAPWCTIPKLPADSYVVPSKVSKLQGNTTLLQTDSLVEVLRLDPEQVELVNTIKTGHQLILACAGSGKSAILIARCFKLAGMDSTKNYLITCYNSNLREYYRWQIDEAGLVKKNVHCMTFHALCRKLIMDANHEPPRDMDGWFPKAKQLLESGKIKTRYYGIFIDEVQIFEPEWYRFCVKLLENQDPDEHILAICGDITQDIKKNIKHSKAPWQGEGLPSYAGRTLHIEKNYRNCKQINQFINAYATCAMEYLSPIEGAISHDTFLRGKAARAGYAPQLIQYYTRDAFAEAEMICKCIKTMHDEQNIGYTDIAVLLFNQFANVYGWKYNILGMLRVALLDCGIPWTRLSWRSDGEIINYQSRTGVSVMTYEGSLGLDYRGIIVAGIPSVGVYSGAYMVTKETAPYEVDDMRDSYVQGFKSLYLACTRAKDSLMMVLPSSDVFSSDYTRILLTAYQTYLDEEKHEE